MNSYRNTLYLKNNKLIFKVYKAFGLDPTSRVYKQCQMLERFAEAIEPQVCVAPIEFTLTEFENQKKQNDVWYSPAFYTHPRGYRMRLRVDSNGYGDGKGTHVSIFLCMMGGAYDASLKWPFQGNVIIQIVNQAKNDSYYQRSIQFTDRTDSNTGRVTHRERWAGQGFSQFISHSSLDSDAYRSIQYLQRDCLRIRILRVKGK